MPNEYCFKCRALQNMDVSDFERMEKDESGRDVRVTVKNYQCSACRFFIRSEETKNPV